MYEGEIFPWSPDTGGRGRDVRRLGKDWRPRTEKRRGQVKVGWRGPQHSWKRSKLWMTGLKREILGNDWLGQRRAAAGGDDWMMDKGQQVQQVMRR